MKKRTANQSHDPFTKKEKKKKREKTQREREDWKRSALNA